MGRIRSHHFFKCLERGRLICCLLIWSWADSIAYLAQKVFSAIFWRLINRNIPLSECQNYNGESSHDTSNSVCYWPPYLAHWYFKSRYLNLVSLRTLVNYYKATCDLQLTYLTLRLKYPISCDIDEKTCVTVLP